MAVLIGVAGGALAALLARRHGWKVAAAFGAVAIGLVAVVDVMTGFRFDEIAVALVCFAATKIILDLVGEKVSRG